jgi:hypothetical protein
MGPPLQMGVSDASCVYIPQFGAMAEDQLAATIANIMIAVIGILSLLYYGWHAYQSTCGWEEIYVCRYGVVLGFGVRFWRRGPHMHCGA